MTDTPTSPHSVPYVPGQLGQTVFGSNTHAEAETSPPPPRRSKAPLLIGGLAVLVVALAGAVAVLAARTSADASKAAASPSWSSVFAPTTPAAAAYSPPPPQEISVPFGETLTLTSNAGDEVHYTVTADKTYAKTKYGTKPKNGVLYGIKVTVEVIDGSTYACACDFAFVAADGTVYEGNGHEVAGGLEAVDLNRKQKAAGIIVFDIPAAAAKGAKIELREGSTNQGFWEVP